MFRRLVANRRAPATRSTLLFARPSFLYGVSKLLDPFRMSQDYNRSRTPNEADILAIRSDWHAIGSDMQQALSLESRHPETHRRQHRRTAQPAGS
jgi:hypothetical protein